MFSAWRTCSAGVGRPQTRPARWPHHFFNCGQSRSGMPTKLKMIVAGSGKVSVDDEVERRGRVDGVQQLVDRGSDPRLHLGNSSRRERPRSRRPQTRVRRRVETDHRRLRFVPAREQDLRRLRQELNERELRGRGGVCLMVEEDRFDVGVARDDVVVDGRGVEHLATHAEASPALRTDRQEIRARADRSWREWGMRSVRSSSRSWFLLAAVSTRSEWESCRVFSACRQTGNLNLPEEFRSGAIDPRSSHRTVRRTQAPNLSAARAFAFAASSSRFLGGAFVSSPPRRRVAMPAISSTATRNEPSFAFDGLLKPLIFLTNWSEAARISSAVTGGSKLKRVLIFLHIIQVKSKKC